VEGMLNHKENQLFRLRILLRAVCSMRRQLGNWVEYEGGALRQLMRRLHDEDYVSTKDGIGGSGLSSQGDST
jgi:hypothetical protein